MSKIEFIVCLISKLHLSGFLTNVVGVIGENDQNQDTIMVYNLNKYKVCIYWDQSVIRVYQWINKEVRFDEIAYKHIYTIDLDGKEIDIRKPFDDRL